MEALEDSMEIKDAFLSSCHLDPDWDQNLEVEVQDFTSSAGERTEKSTELVYVPALILTA